MAKFDLTSFGQRLFTINVEAVTLASFYFNEGVFSGKIDSAHYCCSSGRLILHSGLLLSKISPPKGVWFTLCPICLYQHDIMEDKFC